MRDVLGWRRKFGVIGPSTNTIVQPDFEMMRPPGVTNLSMVKLAAEVEQWLRRPVIAINTATYWHALRANGITDKIYGLGRLLEEF
jgi:maleate cis-trans isomerase